MRANARIGLSRRELEASLELLAEQRVGTASIAPPPLGGLTDLLFGVGCDAERESQERPRSSSSNFQPSTPSPRRACSRDSRRSAFCSSLTSKPSSSSSSGTRIVTVVPSSDRKSTRL